MLEYLDAGQCFVVTPDNLPASVNRLDYQSVVIWPRGSRPAIQDGKPAVVVPGHGTLSAGQRVRGGAEYLEDPDREDLPSVAAPCTHPDGSVSFALIGRMR